MDYMQNDDQRMLSETVERFLHDRAPLGRTRQLLDVEAGFDRDTWTFGCDLGWSALMVPPELGGTGGTGAVLDALAIAEHMGRVLYSGPFVQATVVSDAIVRLADDDQLGRLLPGIVDGSTIASWCWGALSVGEDAGRVAVEHERSGAVLRGEVVGVEAADEADLFLVSAVDGERPVQFIVPAHALGLSIRPMTTVDITRRAARLTFDDVVVGAGAMLEDADGRASLQRQEALATTLHLAETVGMMTVVLAMTTEYMLDRVAFGRPIATYQALKHRAADMRLWVEAAAAATTAAGRALAASLPSACIEVSVAKAYVDDHAVDLVQDCIQIHGGIGLTWEHDLHLFLRRAILNRERFGTPRDHRVRLLDLLEIGGAR